jgi:hypothetical protein
MSNGQRSTHRAASRLPPKGQRDGNTLGEGGRTRTVGSVVHKHKSVASPVGSTRSTDFHMFGPLKNHLHGKRFATDPDAKLAVPSWLEIL